MTKLLQLYIIVFNLNYVHSCQSYSIYALNTLKDLNTITTIRFLHLFFNTKPGVTCATMSTMLHNFFLKL